MEKKDYMFFDHFFVNYLSNNLNIKDKNWNILQLTFKDNLNWTFSIVNNNENTKKIKSIKIVYGNNVSNIKGIWNFTNLEELDLENCNLKELPIEITKLKKLKRLNLQNNNLIEFPKEISNLTSLEYLNLSNNKIKELSSWIWNLTNLIWLSLQNNKIEKIPPEIWNLIKL